MKTVFITGASSGIGKEAANLFQKNGWNVIATMRNLHEETGLEQLTRLKLLQCDVTEPESIKKAINEGIEAFGGIDVLVNNAGIYTTNPLETTSEEEVHRIINTNIIGTINTTKLIIPHFRNKKGGTIINISSVAGRSTFPFQSIYHTSKWAIEGFSEGLQYELEKLNIKIKIIEPGMVKTNLYKSTQSISPNNHPEYYKKSFQNWHSYLLENHKKGFNPIITAKTIYKAATDENFKLRYPSGSDTKTIFLLRKILPQRLFHLIIKNIIKI